jgi:hydrogenase-4 component E
MHADAVNPPVLVALNDLAAGLFLLSALGMVAARQTLACLRLFITQSFFFAVSALLVGAHPLQWDLIAVGLLNLVTKLFLIPWMLRRTVREEVYARREIVQVLNMPTSLLIAMVLTVIAYFVAVPMLHAAGDTGYAKVNLPIGLAALLLGVYTLAVRRESVPQLIGLLAMENGAFFAGIAIVSGISLIAELAIAFDALMLAFVMGVLTRAIQERIGTTEAGALALLKEE